MTKVLMVCLGNICRSPLAEGILQSMVDPDEVFVDSAGTAAYHVGNPPDIRSIDVAKKYGIEIGQQRCRVFTTADFETFDHIYAMDKNNYTNILAKAKNDSQKQKVKLLLREVNLGYLEVQDPYHGGTLNFESVFKTISVACRAIADKINSNGRN
ncbi:MAG: low molecular weight phosphotyrosine protein phosphatase [Croceitalea sp.]|nr:low molecular weight phosphotyrosine protein phosphatase [Croceitalea sp.]MBT8239567.1 low molecular weight phosphotyrosine protein phosphatase [Croceitalea sp.]NNC33912.1 low molecular weight phosphotyrosine protein phosphatase [Croceitalea sp.]NNL08589.1 low molecular weight phosphotyrosine protein phosphatase [Croceitalea sp.]